jgi:hypothetical protein
LFTFRERNRNIGVSCYNVTPLPENCCSTSLFTTVYKRLAEEDHGVGEDGWRIGGFWLMGLDWRMGFLIGGLLVWNAAAAAAGCCVSASLRAKTLREIKENMGQCESKESNFKE